jgi:cell division transport system permease protein
MYKNTFSSLMTVMVIAISLALPTGLHVILKNTQPLVGNLDSITQISLFIKNEIPDQTIQKLRTRLEQHGEIADVLYISRDQGLKDFEEFSGFGGVLNALDENPIPAVLVIHPKHAALNKLDKLQTELRAMPEVDMVQLDMEWLQKMHAIMDIGQRGVTIITTLLALAVLLIVGNTIRLMIQNRRDEIEITKIIGGTDAFIRRPFLYSGVLHGILGGVIAWILIHFIFFLLKGPVHHLALLYQSNFLLMNLSATESLLLIGGSAILGLGGAYLAVSRHIREIEPH